jgi:hypothetical protein
MENSKFQVGKTYGTRSICDHGTMFTMTVLSRTEKTVKVDVHHFGIKSLRVNDKYSGIEQVKPFGSYSMCAIIGANQALKNA